ncbi:hypothetical protein KC19_VG145200 [Ceratodon purpureus]|uniref:Uncharacterized protein n=1 Tax=Ceratodon purpureus TaxID=3225 RepID=A0A8T0HQI4_CERPU|nr:hypothetical protein KC19_VG145200 [Ceratodon purpureus]
MSFQQSSFLTLTQPPNPWENASPPWGPEQPQSFWSKIADVDNARAACKMWKGIIDLSTEWACIKLGRWDYNVESGGHWITCQDHEVSSFAKNWSIFDKSWRMLQPISEDRLRLSSIGHLSCTELNALRSLLRNSGNQETCLAPGQTLSPAADIWVCEHERSPFQL